MRRGHEDVFKTFLATVVEASVLGLSDSGADFHRPGPHRISSENANEMQRKHSKWTLVCSSKWNGKICYSFQTNRCRMSQTKAKLLTNQHQTRSYI